MDKQIECKKFDKKIFDRYEELLKKWQKAINLVSPNTLNNIWERHFEDSLYLYDFIKDKDVVIDIGSGAGFPAMVLSIAGKNDSLKFPKIILIESDERKCFFLNEIKRVYEIKDCELEIKNIRVENLTGENTKNPAETLIPKKNTQKIYITGRAFAPLDKFINLCKNIITKETEMYLLKGENISEEINEATKNWNFNYIIYKKKNGVVINIKDIKRK